LKTKKSWKPRKPNPYHSIKYNAEKSLLQDFKFINSKLPKQYRHNLQLTQSNTFFIINQLHHEIRKLRRGGLT